MHVYNRPGTYAPKELRVQIEGSGLPKVLSLTTGGEVMFASSLSGADESALYAVMDAHTVDAVDLAKSEKISANDSRTSELLSHGFYYSGKIFSLSGEGQLKMLGLLAFKDDPALVYPLRWNSKDDQSYVDLPDAGALHGFCLMALGTMRTVVDGGTALKDQVRDASTVGEVNAIVDNR